MYLKQSEATDCIELQQVHDGDGVIKRRKIFMKSSHLPVIIEIWEMDVGVSEGNHTHPDGDSAPFDSGVPFPIEEIYYINEGSGVMNVDGEEIKITAGDAVMVPPGSDHGIYNTGNNPMKFTIIWGKPDTVWKESLGIQFD